MCWWPEDTEKEEQRGGGKVALVACIIYIVYMMHLANGERQTDKQEALNCVIN